MSIFKYRHDRWIFFSAEGSWVEKQYWSTYIQTLGLSMLKEQVEIIKEWCKKYASFRVVNNKLDYISFLFWFQKACLGRNRVCWHDIYIILVKLPSGKVTGPYRTRLLTFQATCPSRQAVVKIHLSVTQVYLPKPLETLPVILIFHLSHQIGGIVPRLVHRHIFFKVSPVLGKQTILTVKSSLTNDKSTLIEGMAWCHQATCHYMDKHWLRSMVPLGHNELKICPDMCLCFVSIGSWWWARCGVCWTFASWILRTPDEGVFLPVWSGVQIANGKE